MENIMENAKVNMEYKNGEFAVHLLNEQGKEHAFEIQDLFDHLLNSLRGICMPGRYLAIVQTKLEEACFFAKKAMAINLGNQQPSNSGDATNPEA